MVSSLGQARDSSVALSPMLLGVSRPPAPKPKQIRFRPSAAAANPPIHTRGQHVSPFEDLYHRVIGMPWRYFLSYVAAAWFGVNAVFGLLYAAVPGCVSGARAGDLEDAFYFSVQTLATIGYGVMAPATRYGHLVVVLEALVGTIGVALVTGAIFAKFARPTARVLFASKAVVHVRDGVPHLVSRLANWRGNMVVEGQLRVMVLMIQRTREGDTIRLPVELPLVRDRTALFALTWMPMHRINGASPFWGGEHGLGRLREIKAEIFLAFTGLDETIGQPIHARYRYRLDDIVYNARFVDALTIEDDGSRTIDYGSFHDVEVLGDAADLPWTASQS